MEVTKNLEGNAKGDDLGKSTAQTAERLAAVAHDRVDRAVDLARPAVERAAAAAHETVNKVAGAATHAAENLSSKTDYLKDAQTQLAEDCRVYLRDQPVKALGIAVVAGFILSRILRV
jgi:ElaB/YqjD/DUF883 family membrane-anchored ribosome-binding protein